VETRAYLEQCRAGQAAWVVRPSEVSSGFLEERALYLGSQAVIRDAVRKHMDYVYFKYQHQHIPEANRGPGFHFENNSFQHTFSEAEQLEFTTGGPVLTAGYNTYHLVLSHLHGDTRRGSTEDLSKEVLLLFDQCSGRMRDNLKQLTAVQERVEARKVHEREHRHLKVMGFAERTSDLEAQAMDHVDQVLRILVQHNVANWRECGFCKTILNPFNGMASEFPESESNFNPAWPAHGGDTYIGVSLFHEFIQRIAHGSMPRGDPAGWPEVAAVLAEWGITPHPRPPHDAMLELARELKAIKAVAVVLTSLVTPNGQDSAKLDSGEMTHKEYGEHPRWRAERPKMSAAPQVPQVSSDPGGLDLDSLPAWPIHAGPVHESPLLSAFMAGLHIPMDLCNILKKAMGSSPGGHGQRLGAVRGSSGVTFAHTMMNVGLLVAQAAAEVKSSEPGTLDARGGWGLMIDLRGEDNVAIMMQVFGVKMLPPSPPPPTPAPTPTPGGDNRGDNRGAQSSSTSSEPTQPMPLLLVRYVDTSLSDLTPKKVQKMGAGLDRRFSGTVLERTMHVFPPAARFVVPTLCALLKANRAALTKAQRSRLEEGLEEGWSASVLIPDAATLLAKEMLCETCGKPSTHSCARCLDALYCSADCQRDHWQEHKKTCVKIVKKK